MDGSQCGTDEEQDEESSSSNTLEDELAEFRKRWHEELKLSDSRKDSNNDQTNKLHQAIGFYHLGEKAEQSGLMYEAVQLYRKAEHLEPDVESHVRETFCSSISSDDEIYAENGNSEDSEEEEINDNTDLVGYFLRRQRKSNSFCSPMYPFLSTHISDLPPEVVHYILHWVVSKDLDLRSLEQCSMVCRGLYLYARDCQLWKKACERVWGASISLDCLYPSWREMWILKPRVRFNGIYINKASYIRHGDTSFQDATYRPWHMVSYYRYLRFFPEGRFLMITTPEEPVNVVPHLRYRHCNNRHICVGKFCICENIVRAQFQKISTNVNNRTRHSTEHRFHMEFEVKSYRNKPHWILLWRQYMHVSNQNMTSYDLTPTHFPPFWFSRVKSYTEGAEAPI